MTEKKSAYNHSGEVTGSPSERTAETEHRDMASGDPEKRNELRPDERAEEDGYGPRTHPPTRTTRKDQD